MVEARPIGMRIRRPYTSEDEFIRADGLAIGRRGMILIDAPQRPPGLIVRFEIMLADGSCVFRGEGKVVAYRVHTNGRRGLEVRFTALDGPSGRLVDKVLELRHKGFLLPSASGTHLIDARAIGSTPPTSSASSEPRIEVAEEPDTAHGMREPSSTSLLDPVLRAAIVSADDDADVGSAQAHRETEVGLGFGAQSMPAPRNSFSLTPEAISHADDFGDPDTEQPGQRAEEGSGGVEDSAARVEADASPEHSAPQSMPSPSQIPDADALDELELSDDELVDEPDGAEANVVVVSQRPPGSVRRSSRRPPPLPPAALSSRPPMRVTSAPPQPRSVAEPEQWEQTPLAPSVFLKDLDSMESDDAPVRDRAPVGVPAAAVGMSKGDFSTNELPNRVRLLESLRGRAVQVQVPADRDLLLDKLRKRQRAN